MPATSAKSGFGSQLQRDDGTGVFTAIAEVVSIDGPNISRGVVEATNHGSPNGWVERIASGLRDGGEVTVTANMLQDDSTQNPLYSDLNAAARNFRLVYPTATKRLSFAGLVQSISHAFPLNDKMVQNIVIAISGAVTKEAHP